MICAFFRISICQHTGGFFDVSFFRVQLKVAKDGEVDDLSQIIC
jgi:hypothetical protein